MNISITLQTFLWNWDKWVFNNCYFPWEVGQCLCRVHAAGSWIEHWSSWHQAHQIRVFSLWDFNISHKNIELVLEILCQIHETSWEELSFTIGRDESADVFTILICVRMNLIPKIIFSFNFHLLRGLVHLSEEIWPPISIFQRVKSRLLA